MSRLIPLSTLFSRHLVHCLFTTDTAVWEICLLWNQEYTGYSDTVEKIQATIYMLQRCSMQ